MREKAPQAMTDEELGEAIDLAELALLPPAVRAEVAAYAEAVHMELFHGPKARGIYACHIFA